MRYEKYLSLGYDDNGNRIRKHIYADSKDALRVKEREAYIEFDKTPNPSDINFAKYAKQWFETYKSARAEATKEMYQVALRKTSLIDHKRLKDITAMDCQSVINQHKDCPASCEKLSLTLRQVFQRAVKDGIIRYNPADDLTIPKKEKSEERALTPAEKEAIKNADLAPIERLYVNLLYYFGLRPQEALALTAEDFDFKNNLLHIRRAVSYKGNTPYIKPTKTYKPRKMPIPTSFAKYMKSYLKTIGTKNKGILVSQDGNLMSKTMKSDLWLRIKSKINGDESLHPYVFRHNYCCECYYMGLSILKTSELLGNSPQMVLKVYAHLDNSKEDLSKLSDFSM